MKNRQLYESLQGNVLERYQNRYYKEGETPKALGWGCREDQVERFRTLCKYNSFEGKTILDLGCGFGDFYGYLLDNHICCNYTGIDVIPEFIECCRKKYPDAEFLNKDIMLDTKDIPMADYVISIGTLNFKLQEIDNLNYTKSFMYKAFEKAKVKAIFDFLSTQLTKNYPKEDTVYYHNPKDVIDIVFGLSDNIELIHNYKPIPQKEFMVIISRE